VPKLRIEQTLHGVESSIHFGPQLVDPHVHFGAQIVDAHVHVV